MGAFQSGQISNFCIPFSKIAKELKKKSHDKISSLKECFPATLPDHTLPNFQMGKERLACVPCKENAWREGAAGRWSWGCVV